MGGNAIMKESDNCKKRLVCLSEKSEDGQFPECRDCIYETVCNELESKVIDRIYSLGLHEKLDDPLNVANIIDYYQQNGIDCEILYKRFWELANAFPVKAHVSKDKKFLCAYIEVKHKLEAAKK